MAAQSLPRSICEAAHRAVAQHGSVKRAAAAMGIKPKTLSRRYLAALERFGMPEVRTDPKALASLYGCATPKVEGIVAPELASEDEDLEAIIERLAAEHRRRKTASDARKWMRFTVEGDGPFALAFIGDPHGDQCDIDQLRSDFDLIRDTPRMWAVGLGDYINQWNKKLFHKYAAQSVTERDAYRIARWIFAQPIWLLLIKGNHDGLRWHGSGSPLDWMQHSAPVDIQEWQAQFEVACGSRSWRIWAAHDFPGNSLWNPLHGPGRRAQLTGAVADLFICGDHHVFGLAQTQHEHTGTPYWIARARGYKPRDEYALEMGYGEQTMGHSIAAVCDPSDGTMTCFADIRRAASYLRWLGGEHDKAASCDVPRAGAGKAAAGAGGDKRCAVPGVRSRVDSRQGRAATADVQVPAVRAPKGRTGR